MTRVLKTCLPLVTAAPGTPTTHNQLPAPVADHSRRREMHAIASDRRRHGASHDENRHAGFGTGEADAHPRVGAICGTMAHQAFACQPRPCVTTRPSLPRPASTR